MERKPVLLHVHMGASSFVLKDRRLLSTTYEVRDLPFVWDRKWQLPFLFVKQAFRLLFGSWRWHAVVVQFGGYHALLPSLMARSLGRKCLIIAGGTDCVSLPSIGYGNFARQPLAYVTALAYRACSCIVPVHESLVRSRNLHQRNDPPEQGLLYHVPDLKTPITVVPNGYDAGSWTLGTIERDVDVLTVTAGEADSRTFVLKGIDLVIATACALPHLRFAVVGLGSPEKAMAPPNVLFEPTLPPDRLRTIYHRARFYAQLSLSEGFPNAVCEAMLSGCMPIVSDVGAMPDIVGSIGAVVHDHSVAAVIQALTEQQKAYTITAAHAARERIAENYPEERRGRELLALLAAPGR